MSRTVQPSIAIIGAGAIGLTSAISLLEQGYAVTLFAQELPPNTTSDIAAAYWAPEIALDGPRLTGWVLASWRRFQALTADPASGVTFAMLHQLSDESTDAPSDPFAAISAELSAICQAQPTSAGRFSSVWTGLSMRVAKIDTPIYMPWLYKQCGARGGVIKQGTIEQMDTLYPDFPIIINCSGLGARLLTGDALFPIRGQVISVCRPPDLPPDILSAHRHGVQDDAAVTYIIPRSGDCLLGGTFQYGNGDRQVDPAIAEGILQRCAAFYPSLAKAEILRHRVGLRPGRGEVRLETERRPDGGIVLHNYGHAAYGHTLSWGCAEEVVKRVQAV